MKQRKEKYFKCNCCGIEFTTRANRILRCAPCAKEHKYPQYKDDIKWRLNRLSTGARNRAKSRNHDFSIDLDYLIYLWEFQEGTCTITGRKFDLSGYNGVGKINPNTVSIDRIIPEKGYVAGNIRLVTFHANMAISEFGLDSFILLAKDILKTSKSNSDKEING